jgi:hypothetical protein
MSANVLIVPIGAERPSAERSARRAEMRAAIADKYDAARETGTIIVEVRDLDSGGAMVFNVSWEVNGVAIRPGIPDVRKDAAVVVGALREAGFKVVDQTRQ